MEMRPYITWTTRVIFAGLLVTPWFFEQNSIREYDSSAASSISFSEVAAEVGIDFVHETSRLDSALDHILPEIVGMGASVSVVDYDGDGLLDLYLTTSSIGGQNALYRNLGDRFLDVSAELGLANLNQEGTGVSTGSVWADYNNDGLQDFFLYKWGKIGLFKQLGDGTFEDASKESGIDWWMNAGTALWFDFDLDGDLDLYIGGYYRKEIDLWHLTDTKIMPNSFEYSTNGGRNFLMENRGDGTFVDVTEAMNADCRCWSLAVGSADLSGDGYPDLIVANDYGVDLLLINRGGTSFQRSVPGNGAPKSGMNVAFGDVHNDSSLSVYITNISKSGYLSQGNDLWRPLKPRSTEAVNISTAAGVENAGWAWGGQFGDIDNDGFLDLVVVNGFISAHPQKDYWYHMSKIAMGSDYLFEDAKNWPPLGDRSLSGYERTKVYLNDGHGSFRDVAAGIGVNDRLDGRAVVLADFFNRGRLDMVVANQRGPTLFYSRNDIGDSRHWIAFDLTATKGHHSAVGASVTLHWNGYSQKQIVTAGLGYSSQMPLRLHFGLGDEPTLSHATVRWPSGTLQKITELTLDSRQRIVEPNEPPL